MTTDRTMCSYGYIKVIRNGNEWNGVAWRGGGGQAAVVCGGDVATRRKRERVGNGKRKTRKGKHEAEKPPHAETHHHPELELFYSFFSSTHTVFPVTIIFIHCSYST